MSISEGGPVSDADLLLDVRPETLVYLETLAKREGRTVEEAVKRILDELAKQDEARASHGSSGE